jgi:Sulfatase
VIWRWPSTPTWRSTLALLALLGAVACTKEQPKVDGATGEPTTPAAPAASGALPVDRRSVPLWPDLGLCDVRHRGLVIDAASDWADAHRGYVLGPFTDVAPSERGLSALAPVLSGRTDYDFWFDRPAKGVRISLRVQAQSAARLGLEIDGIRLPEQRLPAEPKVLTFGPIPTELGTGRHLVSLRFAGRNKNKGAARASIEWLRLHLPDEGDAYMPPTKSSVLQDVVLGDQPRRAVVLRAPGSLRCAVFPQRGSRLALELGYWGNGEGLAQVRVLTQDGRSVLLAQQKVSAEEQQGSWTPLELSLDAFDRQLVAVEFEALETSVGGRVAFAEPRFVYPEAPKPNPRAKNVVLVVASGISRRLIPPWAEHAAMPHLSELARNSTVFEGYRANSTLVSAVLATLLSGATVRQHHLYDLSTRVPSSLPLFPERLRALGGSSGFFSNVPFSFDAFGFNRGWNQHETYSPVRDLPATEPLRVGRHWLEENAVGEAAPRLLVVHASAGHPPWDVTLDETKFMEPKDYVGLIDARRGAASLGDVRTGRVKQKALSTQDWVRLTALQQLSLQKLDQSLGALIGSLEKLGQWNDTLFVFMGDVAMGDPPVTPLAPLGSLEEPRLTPPLFIKFPSLHGGNRVSAPIGPDAVARTLSEALGIPWSGPEATPVLAATASGTAQPIATGLLALQNTRFAYSLGAWLLAGHFGDTPSLCDIEADPTCQENARRRSRARTPTRRRPPSSTRTRARLWKPSASDLHLLLSPLGTCGIRQPCHRANGKGAPWPRTARSRLKPASIA